MVAARDTLVGGEPPPPPAGPQPGRRIGAGMLLALGALVLVAAPQNAQVVVYLGAFSQG